MNSLLLCENIAFDTEQYDNVFYWSSYDIGADEYSIPKYVEDNYVLLKQKYLDWLHELGNTKINGRSIIEHLSIRADFSFWWMSLLVEKSQWKSSRLYDVFRLMAFDSLIKGYKVDKIVITIEDSLVQKVIKQWCFENDVECDIQVKSKAFNKLSTQSFINLLPHTFKAIASVPYYLISRWAARSTKMPFEYKAKKNAVCIISYLFHFDNNKAKKGTFYSGYWTAMHQLLEQKGIQVNWLHVFVKSNAVPNLNIAAKFINHFNRSKPEQQSHQLLDSKIGWPVAFNVVRDYTKTWLAAWRLGKVEHLFRPQTMAINLWPVLEYDWKDALFGRTSISNCFFLNLFETTFANLPYQRQGLYLLEHQAWERSLIYAWRKAGHGELIGVQHATVRDWDLRNFFVEDDYNSVNNPGLPIPDKVALNGEVAIKTYLDGGFPKQLIFGVEALRYLHLDIKKEAKIKQENLVPRLLVLGDYIPGVTKMQMQVLANAVKKLSKKMDIIVKAHPACSIKAEEWKEIEMTVVNDPFDELVDRFDIAYVSNLTSAAIDVHLSGKRVITLLDPDTFNMSPLRRCKGVEYVMTANELAEKLEENRDGHGITLNSDFFYIDRHLPRWSSLMNEEGE